MRITIKTRRDTASEWTSVNPILSLGEMGIETDTRKIKFGDGTTEWNSLQYISAGTAGEVVAEDIDDRISELLVAGSGIILNYDDDGNSLTISASGSSLSTVDVLSFNIDDESTLTKGQISWDDTEGTMDIGLTDNTTIHIGEHRFYRIRNTTGNTLYKGQVVYATGVHSNGLITPNLYISDNSIDEVRFIGTILEDVDHNNNGYVIDFGHLQNLDLDGSARPYAVGDETWSAGDILYAHPTVSGKLTNVKPTHAITVAIIQDIGNGNGNGKMFVRPSTFGDLGDNHDVTLTYPIATNNVLAFDSNSWRNKSLDISLIQKGSVPFPFYSNIQMGYYYSWTIGSEAVINEGSNDINFRVEGNSEQNLLFVDAGSDKVGIAKNNPVYDLDVAGSGNFTDGVYVDGAPVVQSNVTGITGASSVNNIVAISQSDYDNLPSYDSNTIYIING